MHLLRQPLIRLLVVNLAGGMAAALLMLGGLLALNPGNLRNLILADETPGAALGLLLFGLVVTFGSVAMGSAIMGLGARRKHRDRSGGGRGPREPAEVRVWAGMH
jgi:hypothetical protein